MLDYISYAGHVRADDRKLARHRFQKSLGAALVLRRQHEHFRPIQQFWNLFIGQGSAKIHAAACRRDLAQLHEQIENMRRQWRNDNNMLPKYDLFIEVVQRPMAATAEAIQLEIQKRLNEEEFILVDEGDIPERFKEWVTDYFKDLSESEGNS